MQVRCTGLWFGTDSPATRGAGGGPNGTSDAGRRGSASKRLKPVDRPSARCAIASIVSRWQCRWPIKACAVGVERRLVVMKVVAVQSCTGWLGSSRRAPSVAAKGIAALAKWVRGAPSRGAGALGAERLALGRLCTEVFQAQPLLGRRRRSAHHAPPATSTAPMARNGHSGIPPEARGAAAGGPGRPVPAVVNWNGHEPDTT